MLAEAIQRAFPAGVAVPPALAALARYQEGRPGFYSGRFWLIATDGSALVSRV